MGVCAGDDDADGGVDVAGAEDVRAGARFRDVRADVADVAALPLVVEAGRRVDPASGRGRECLTLSGRAGDYWQHRVRR